jgi:copper homeostasis protein (lipoprotein)
MVGAVRSLADAGVASGAGRADVIAGRRRDCELRRGEGKARQEWTMRISKRIAAALVALPLLQACKAVEPAMEPIPVARQLRLPATFTGDLPCSDCAMVRYHLDLWPDNGYQMRRVWVGRDLERDEIGGWSLDPGGNGLILYGAGEMPLRFEIIAPDRLRLVDTIGGPVASGPTHELKSDGQLHLADLTLTLGGEMTYMADAASFTECMTGRRYPIAMEGDFVKLERAYVAAVAAPGAKLYVSFDGSIIDRPKMEGEGVERTVVVNRFINVWPGEQCERARAHASLSNTYWRIVRLGGDAVRAAEGHREPHLVLREGDGRRDYSATVGCNKLAGDYSVDAESISFRPAASTAAPCAPPLAAMERSLAAMLAKAESWRITASTMEFFDAAGQPVALFEAVYLR